MPFKKRSHVSNNCNQRCNTSRKRIKRSNDSDKENSASQENGQILLQFVAPNLRNTENSASKENGQIPLQFVATKLINTENSVCIFSALTKANWSSCRRSRWYHQIPSCPFSSSAYSTNKAVFRHYGK